jgi:hypothetical protein
MIETPHEPPQAQQPMTPPAGMVRVMLTAVDDTGRAHTVACDVDAGEWETAADAAIAINLLQPAYRTLRQHI